MSAMVAVSALAGYLVHPAVPDPAEAALVTTAVFLLAAGCSAFNQVQERAEDAQMERTRRRPLPAGRLTVASALVVATALSGFALILLARLKFPVAGWGLATVLLYNGLYTGLKKRTPFALLAGALCGALPPLIGWSAAGGNPTDHRIVGLAALFLLWQIPHTWALCVRHSEDRNSAPFPSLFRYFDAARMARLQRIWLLALAVATLHLPAFGSLRSPLVQMLALTLSAGLLLCGAGRFGSAAPPSSRRRSEPRRLTLFMAALLGLVMLDRLMG
jgi:protoheme IX farnesyltransferase